MYKLKETLLPISDYLHIFHKVPGLYLLLKPENNSYTIIDANEAYLKATMTHRNQIVGKNVFEVFPDNPSDHLSLSVHKVKLSFDSVLEKKAPHELTKLKYDIPDPDKKTFTARYWNTLNIPVFNADNEVEYIIHSATDVTEKITLEERELAARKEAEAQRQRLFKVFMQAPMAIALFSGSDYIIELANPSMCRLLRRDEDNLLGKPFFEAVPGAGGKGFEERLSAVLASGESAVGVEVPVAYYKNDQKHFFYFNYIFEPIKDVKGFTNSIIVIATNVTEQVLALNNLAESETRLNLALESSRMGVWDYDLEAGIIKRSARHDQVFGHEEQLKEWTFDTFISHIHPDDRGLIMKNFQKDLNENRLDYKIRVIWPDGSVHWIRSQGYVYRNAAKKAVRMLGTVVDITEQKYQERQREEFIGIVSHELKTPVTSMKAFGQVLHKRFLKAGDQDAAVLLEKMDVQINRLTHLIQDLLDVTLIESGKLQFHESYFDAEILISEIVEDVQRTTVKHQIVKQLDIPEKIFGDRERIGQVLINFLTNAIKYSPDNEQIIVRAYFENSFFKCSVQDFGIGISQENQEKIFERFFRVSGEKSHTYPGMGLGLYISSEIIERQNGNIWIKSELGKGAIFGFTIPLRHKNFLPNNI